MQTQAAKTACLHAGFGVKASSLTCAVNNVREWKIKVAVVNQPINYGTHGKTYPVFVIKAGKVWQRKIDSGWAEHEQYVRSVDLFETLLPKLYYYSSAQSRQDCLDIDKRNGVAFSRMTEQEFWTIYNDFKQDHYTKFPFANKNWDLMERNYRADWRELRRQNEYRFPLPFKRVLPPLMKVIAQDETEAGKRARLKREYLNHREAVFMSQKREKKRLAGVIEINQAPVLTLVPKRKALLRLA